MKITDPIVGCILGGAIGDALGFPVEKMDPEKRPAEVNFRECFRQGEGFPAGTISDDTQMTLILMDAIQEIEHFSYSDSPDQENLIDLPFIFMDKLSRERDNLVGAGKSTLGSIDRFLETGDLNCGEQKRFGNGAMIRTAPLGLVPWENISTLDYVLNQTLRDLSISVSMPTHRHYIASHAASYMSEMVYQVTRKEIIDPTHFVLDVLRRSQTCSEIDLKLMEAFQKWGQAPHSTLNFLPDEPHVLLPGSLGSGFSAHEAVACVLFCLMSGRFDFQESVSLAVQYAGDADSIASMVGQICGAYRPQNIPHSWVEFINETHPDIFQKAKSFSKFVETLT